MLALNFIIAYGCPLFVLLVLQPVILVFDGGSFNIFLIVLKMIYSLLLVSLFDGPLFVAFVLSSFFVDSTKLLVRVLAVLVSSVVNYFFCEDLFDSVGVFDALWKIGLNPKLGKVVVVAISFVAVSAVAMKLCRIVEDVDPVEP